MPRICHPRALMLVSGSGGWRVVTAALLLAAPAALTWLRAPQIFSQLRLFADEATYFSRAYSQPWWESLFGTHVGYFSLLVNLGATLAAHAVPLEVAPLPYLLLGFGGIALMTGVVLLRGSPFDTPALQAVAVYLLLFAAPISGRFDLSIVQFHLVACAAVVLVSDGGGGGARWLRRGALALAGLTGVVALVLTPLFWIRGWATASRERFVQASILTTCCLVHAGFLLAPAAAGAPAPGPPRWAGLELDVLLAAVASKSIVLPLLGWDAMQSAGALASDALAGAGAAGHYAAVLAASLLAAFAVTAAAASPLRGKEWLTQPGTLLALGYWMLVGFAFLFGQQAGDSRLHYVTRAHRYFMAPNALLVLALLLQLREGGGRRLASGVLLAWLALSSAAIYALQTPTTYWHGPGWRSEVARWRANPSYVIKVWPGQRLWLKSRTER